VVLIFLSFKEKKKVQNERGLGRSRHSAVPRPPASPRLQMSRKQIWGGGKKRKKKRNGFSCCPLTRASRSAPGAVGVLETASPEGTWTPVWSPSAGKSSGRAKRLLAGMPRARRGPSAGTRGKETSPSAQQSLQNIPKSRKSQEPSLRSIEKWINILYSSRVRSGGRREGLCPLARRLRVRLPAAAAEIPGEPVRARERIPAPRRHSRHRRVIAKLSRDGGGRGRARRPCGPRGTVCVVCAEGMEIAFGRLSEVERNLSPRQEAGKGTRRGARPRRPTSWRPLGFR